MKKLAGMIVAMMLLCSGPQAFAQGSGKVVANNKIRNNGGFIFQKPKDKSEQIKEDADKRAQDALKRTEKLNKDLKAQRKKEAKAKAKAKKEAEKMKRQAAKKAHEDP